MREEAHGALTPTQTARGCDRHSEVTGPKLNSLADERDEIKAVLRQEGGQGDVGTLDVGGASPSGFALEQKAQRGAGVGLGQLRHVAVAPGPVA